MSKYRHLLLLLVLMLHGSAYAARNQAVQIKPLNAENSRKTQLEEEQSARQQWGLSVTEWTRYKTLMKGIRGSISPANISPIEVLGTHARTDKERQKYAEIWAQMRHDDAGRILAFQRAYNQAFRKLYGHEKLIDVSKLDVPQPDTGAGYNRILVFIKHKDCEACERVLNSLLLDPQYQQKQVDIYFTDLGKPSSVNDRKIRQWAQQSGISKIRLQNRSITLNYNQGNLYKITGKLLSPIPSVFKVSKNSILPVKL